MCELCEAKTESYIPHTKSEVVDGVEIPIPPILGRWWLVRATKDGDEMKAGDWGLVGTNTPFLIWQTTPKANPYFYNNVINREAFESEETIAELDQHYDLIDKFSDEIQQGMLYPSYSFELGAHARNIGWNPDDCRFEVWFFQYLGELLEKYPDPIREEEEKE